MENRLEANTVHDQLEELRVEFIAGNKSVLLTAIGLAFRSNAPAPSWLVDAVQDAEDGLDIGRYADINNAFGWTTAGKKKRCVAQRQARNKSKILAALVRYRISGGSLNAELAFRPIAKELNIPWQDVRDVYTAYGKFIKTIPQHPTNKTDTYSFADVTLHPPTLSATANAAKNQPSEQ